MKKSFALVAAVLLVSVLSTPSFALVRIVTECSTKDGQYRISIIDNQGIGPVRASRLFGTVESRDGHVLGSYALVALPAQPIRTVYSDAQTGGQLFMLSVPVDTGVDRHIFFDATLNNGQKMQVVDPVCHAFGL